MPKSQYALWKSERQKAIFRRDHTMRIFYEDLINKHYHFENTVEKYLYTKEDILDYIFFLEKRIELLERRSKE
jgi:hypothetical protein